MRRKADTRPHAPASVLSLAELRRHNPQGQVNYQKMLVSLFMLLLAFFIALTSQSLLDQQRAKQVMQSMRGTFSTQEQAKQATLVEDSYSKALIDRMDRIEKAMAAHATLSSRSISGDQGQMVFDLSPDSWFDGKPLRPDVLEALKQSATIAGEGSYMKLLLVMSKDELAAGRLSQWAETMTGSAALQESQLLTGIATQDKPDHAQFFIIIR
ncbi:hypothetical protein GC177_04540 [bacterium]|nr:hypothetical protein [bacterium]